MRAEAAAAAAQLLQRFEGENRIQSDLFACNSSGQFLLSSFLSGFSNFFNIFYADDGEEDADDDADDQSVLKLPKSGSSPWCWWTTWRWSPWWNG
jgi:hypothetical protein